MLDMLWNRYPVLLMPMALILLVAGAAISSRSFLATLVLMVLGALLGIVGFVRQVHIDEKNSSGRF